MTEPVDLDRLGELADDYELDDPCRDYITEAVSELRAHREAMATWNNLADAYTGLISVLEGLEGVPADGRRSTVLKAARAKLEELERKESP